MSSNQWMVSRSMAVIPVRLLLFAVCIGLGGDSVASAQEAGDIGGPWKAGISKAIITPDKDVWLAGYGTKRSPDGKLHDIWMKSLALEDTSGNRAVLVTSDFMGVPKGMSDRVFDHLQRKFGLERKQVMITFSHNHCGPRLEDDLIDYYPVDSEQEQLVAEYTSQMVERMVSLVGESLEQLSPATLAVGRGTASFAVNRRNNPEAKVPELLAAGMPFVGPVDHSVPVLQVTRPDGSIAAILFGYACHPTTLNFMTWCGDYPGFAQIEIESMHPGAVAMFVNTCGGDQNPLPRRSVDLCQKYGHMLAVGVEEALHQPLKPVDSTLQVAYKSIDLEYERVVGKHDLEVAAADTNPIKVRWVNRMLKKLEAGEAFQPSYPYPLHVWRLGGGTILIGMGGETLVDYALAFKRTWGPETWVLGYSDDMIAYIPSRRVWEEGGYEGTDIWECGHPAIRWAGDIEDRIVKAVADLVEAVGHPAPKAAAAEDSACGADTKTIVTAAASTPELPRKSEGDVIELEDGHLLLVYMEFGGDGEDDSTTRLVSRESADGGLTWSQHRVVADTVAGDMNVYSPSLIRSKDGGIFLIFMRQHCVGSLTNYVWKSIDEGKTFSPFAEFAVKTDLSLCNSTVKRLASGRLLLPASPAISGEHGPMGPYAATVLYSDDDGLTWHEAANRLNLPMRGAMEPHVEQASDGRVLMVMRNQLGALHLSESSDDGVTWSEPRTTGLTSPESCPELTRIPSTGDLLMIWNNSYDPNFASHYGKRSPLTTAVSQDNGRTWQHIRDIEIDPMRAYSNPGCRFTRRGKAILNYWTCEYLPTWLMQNRIDLRVAIIDSSWFYESLTDSRAQPH